MHFSPAPVIPRSILESAIMSSQRRTESARANGVRSHGPVTESGKQISSQNALRHTLLARCVVVEGESTEGFEETLTEHLDRFEPADGVEFGIVEEMVAAWWRMRHRRLGHRNLSAVRLRRRPAPVRRNGPLGRRLLRNPPEPHVSTRPEEPAPATNSESAKRTQSHFRTPEPRPHSSTVTRRTP